MASNGIVNPAKTGKCRICQRVRKTYNKVIPVGEVHRGYATGHVWECADHEDCERVARKKLEKEDIRGVTRAIIEIALERGHITDYPIYI